MNEEHLDKLLTDIFGEQLQAMLPLIAKELATRPDGKMSVKFSADIHQTPKALIAAGSVSYTPKKVSVEPTGLQIDLDKAQIKMDFDQNKKPGTTNEEPNA